PYGPCMRPVVSSRFAHADPSDYRDGLRLAFPQFSGLAKELRSKREQVSVSQSRIEEFSPWTSSSRASPISGSAESRLLRPIPRAERTSDRSARPAMLEAGRLRSRK